MSERSVRNYCAIGKIPDAVLEGKTWKIPANADKPKRINAKAENTLLSILQEEKKKQRKGGIYHKIQIDLTYNSNHIEGNMLSEEQTRYIYETNTIAVEKMPINIDDIIETVNHFQCFDYILDYADEVLTENIIKEMFWELYIL